MTLPSAPRQTISADDLTQIARTLQTEVAKSDNVGRIYLAGDAQDAIQIQPNPDRLALYGPTGRACGAPDPTAPAKVSHLLPTTRDRRSVYAFELVKVAYVADTSGPHHRRAKWVIKGSGQ